MRSPPARGKHGRENEGQRETKQVRRHLGSVTCLMGQTDPFLGRATEDGFEIDSAGLSEAGTPAFLSEL